MSVTLTFHHNDNTTTHYHVGDDETYRTWEIRPHGIVLKRTDGRGRKHLHPGSFVSFDVIYDTEPEEHTVHTYGMWHFVGEDIIKGVAHFVRHCLENSCQASEEMELPTGETPED